MSKVFILNHGPYDYSPAEEFGSLTFITEGKLPRLDVAGMFRECDDALRGAEESDYLLLTGLTVLASVACAIFARRFGRLNLLLWDGKRYIPRTIIFNDESSNEQEKGEKQ